MERILGGMIVAVAALMLWMVPAASAAPEIPPTPGCEATFKRLLKVYNDELPSNATPKQIAEVDRRFYTELAEANCITSAEPLIKAMPAKPYSEQCVEAAADAQAFWGPLTAKYKALVRNFRRSDKRYRKRSKALVKRVAHLKRDDRPRQAAALNRKRNRLKSAHKSQVRTMGRKARPIIFGPAYKTLLIVTEFTALRCMSNDLFSDEELKGPAWRAFLKNGPLVIGQIFWVAFKEFDDSGSSDDSASRSITNSPIPAGQPDQDAARSRLPGPLANLVD